MKPLPDPLEIPSGVIAEGVVRPPGSKSLTNRAVLLAALARGTTTVRNALASEDTEVMRRALVQLGVPVQQTDGGALLIRGVGGVFPASEANIFVANSGTTIRFLTAALAAAPSGTYRLYGVPRMHERPIGELVAALRELGADIEFEQRTGYPPLTIHARGLRGGEIDIHGSVSSQFLSGILMAAPLARGPITIRLIGPLVSAPFVTLTTRLMERFAVSVASHWLVPPTEAGRVPQGTPVAEFRVTPAGYRPCELTIEPDATAASYFWGAAAITGGCVTVPGLGPQALQGDVRFVHFLEQMGATITSEADSIAVHGGKLKGIDADLCAVSDTAPTLAVVALFAQGKTRLSGLTHTRHQETDRVHALATELRRLGARVQEQTDGITIQPGRLTAAIIETYNDHRIAMAFALAGLRVPGVAIRNPSCTAKTYPDYWDDLFRLLRPKG